MALPGDPVRTRAADDGPGDAGASGPLDLVGGDWPRQATDQIVSVVDQVRAKTTGPVLQGSRAVVYGLVVTAAVAIAGLLVLIGTVRFLNLITDRPWLSYLILGLSFVTLGWGLWRRREAR